MPFRLADVTPTEATDDIVYLLKNVLQSFGCATFFFFFIKLVPGMQVREREKCEVLLKARSHVGVLCLQLTFRRVNFISHS